MRSDKKRAECANQRSRVHGKLALDYLQATAPIHERYADQKLTVGKSKDISKNNFHYFEMEYQPTHDEMQKKQVFRDVTNLEMPTQIYSVHEGEKQNQCSLPKCRRNVELLEKSIEMIEQLKFYVSQASIKTETEKKKKAACVQTDLNSPNRPGLAQTLELLWTTNCKHENEETFSQKKPSKTQTVSIQTDASSFRLDSATGKKQMMDNYCQTGEVEDEFKTIAAKLKISLEEAERSKCFLNQRVKDLQLELRSLSKDTIDKTESLKNLLMKVKENILNSVTFLSQTSLAREYTRASASFDFFNEKKMIADHAYSTEVTDIVQDCLLTSSKIIPSVKAFVKQSFQASLRFIADDIESELTERLVYTQKRFALMQKKFGILTSAVKNFKKTISCSKLMKDCSTSCDLTRTSTLTVEVLPYMVVEGISSSLKEVNLDIDNSIRDLTSPSQHRELTISLTQEDNDSTLFHLEKSLNSKTIDAHQLEKVNTDLRDMMKTADKVYDLMEKFKKIALSSNSLPGIDVQTEGRLNLVQFQSEKLAQQLVKLLEAIAVLSGSFST